MLLGRPFMLLNGCYSEELQPPSMVGYSQVNGGTFRTPVICEVQPPLVPWGVFADLPPAANAKGSERAAASDLTVSQAAGIGNAAVGGGE